MDRRGKHQISQDLEGEAKFDSDRWKLFRPFPRQTSTLVAGPSFLGKSTYVRKLVEYQHLFFQDPVARLVVINCNKAVSFSPLEEPKDKSPFRRPLAELIQRTWEDFDVGDLEEGDVLLIDDLQYLTDRVREIVNAVTHHLALGHCFLVTHSVLGSRQYELLNLVHRIALFCSSTSVANLAGYVLSTRILDSDLKSRLKEALGAAQRSREVLVLELSALPETAQPYHVACSHLLRLTDPKSGFAVVYPHPSRIEMYEADADSLEKVELREPAETSASLPGPSEFVTGSFLILRPEQVAEIKRKKKDAKKREETDDGVDEDGECLDLDEKRWNSTVLQMEADIENFLPSKQWLPGKSLLYEILHNPQMCLLQDGRRIKLHDRPGVVTSLIDYLTTATRRNAPNEKRAKGQTLEYKTFRQITAALLDEHAPKTLFKNLLVLPRTAELTKKRDSLAKKTKPRRRRRHQRRGQSSDTTLEMTEDIETEDLDFSFLN